MAIENKKIAQEAREACEAWRGYFSKNNERYHELFEFIMGKQWEDKAESLMNTMGKVPMTSNKLGVLANTMLGELQQNTPQLEVLPKDNCSEQTAEIRELVLKDIVFSGKAKKSYMNAAKQAFIGGFGAYGIETKYLSSDSFDLSISFFECRDPTSWYWDSGAEERTKTDGMHCGYITRMSREKVRQKYGKKVEEKITKVASPTASKAEIAAISGTGYNGQGISWVEENYITINHFFKRSYEKQTLYKLSNGRAVFEAELDEIVENSKRINEEMMMAEAMQQSMMNAPDMIQESYGMEMEIPNQEVGLEEYGEEESEQEEKEEFVENVPEEEDAQNELDADSMTLYDGEEIVRIEDKREVDRSIITHYKLAGDYELEKSIFPSERLPLVFVDQNSWYDKDGQQICKSFFYDALDDQKYINYLRTQAAYTMKTMRYDQYMAPKKVIQSPDVQNAWRNPMLIQGVLVYDGDGSAKPEPMARPELSQSLTTQYQVASEDLYTSTGLYPSRLGEQGNEVSGKAINARIQQGSYPTSTAYGAVNEAITEGGSIINEMIPEVYDSERIINLMTPDKGRKNITINKQDEYGNIIENDLKAGSFEVRLVAGPSFEGQKQAYLDALREVLQVNPEIFNLVIDLYAENLPLANTIEIKNRLKTLVPPEIIEAGKTGEMPQPQQKQPSPEEQMAMAEQQYKQEELELKKQELMQEKEKNDMEFQAKMREIDADMAETAAKVQDQEMRYLAETERTASQQQISHADNLVKLLTSNTNFKQERGNK